MIKLAKRISQYILTWRFPLLPVAIAIALTSPSLWVGLQADDYFIRNTARGELPPELVGIRPYETYSYLDGNPERNQLIIDQGYMPWWTDPQCHISFGRPLTGLTQMADFRLWPNHPMLMHVHSLLWFALLVALAAILYRRILGHSASTAPVWAAGLAALLFAVDDAHAIPASWLANRNSTIAAVFGVASLIAHDRWRRNGWRLGAAAGPVLLFEGLCGKEEAISTSGYLLAYSVFLDRGAWRDRLCAMLPYLTAGAVWFAIYRASGYGVYASGGYINPLNSPIQFARRALENAPILLLGQWGLPPADLSNIEAAPLFAAHLAVAVVLLALLAVLFWPLLRRDAVGRFWCLGMLLAVVPVCAIFPSDRLLLFVGLGAIGLLASWMSGLAAGGAWLPTGRSWIRMSKCGLIAFVALHLVLAPLLLPVQSLSMKFAGDYLADIQNTLSSAPEIASRNNIFVSSFTAVADSAWIQRRAANKMSLPKGTLCLAPAACDTILTRSDEFTLKVRPEGGFLKPARSSVGGRDPLLSLRVIGRHLDRIVRAPDRMFRLNDTIDLSIASITVTELTEDGRPAEATFEFRRPLEDASHRWLAATLDGYVEFEIPHVGETVVAPSPFDRK